MLTLNKNFKYEKQRQDLNYRNPGKWIKGTKPRKTDQYMTLTLHNIEK